MSIRTLAVASMLIAIALPAAAKCTGVSISELAARSDVIASGTISGAEVHQYAGLVIATAVLNADGFIKPPPANRSSFTIFAIWPAAEEREREENCLAVDLRQEQGTRALWFLTLRPGALAEVGPGPPLIRLTDSKLVRAEAEAIRRQSGTSRNEATVQRVIDFLIQESDRLGKAREK